jgi:hypothetical protein
MDIHRCFSSKHIVNVLACLAVVAILVGSPVRAQEQPARLSDHYAKAALLSLFAIESDISAPKDMGGEAAEMSATRTQIDAADAKAVTTQEESITKMLRQIYQLKLQDNDLLRAYRKLAEIENAEDASDLAATKKQKDYAAAQIADSEAAIEKREETCFGQLEESLRERSPQSIPACSDWIRRAKISKNDPANNHYLN